MRINIRFIMVLAMIYSCSAQKHLQKERCNIMNDFYEGRINKIDRRVLTASDIESRDVKFKTSDYFDIKSLNDIYIGAAMYKFQKETFCNVENIYSLLSDEDLKFMQEQYENSRSISSNYLENCLTYLNYSSEEINKLGPGVISVPLLSVDNEKCMYFYFSDFSRQTIPAVFFCRKEEGVWKIVARIEGSLYDTSP